MSVSVFAAFAVTIIYLLLSEVATLSEASGIIIMMIGMAGSVSGVYTWKRTEEKKEGVADQPKDFMKGP